jgi:hypothetical protein
VTQEHDPLLQANVLRQCLAHDKRPLGVLLGAGCPMAIRVKRGGAPEPLIPDIEGMTKRVEATLIASASRPQYELVLSHFRKDGLADPNVEQILSHIRSLRQVAGKDSVRGLALTELDGLDEAVCNELAEACAPTLPDGPTPYHFLASWIGARERVAPVEIFTTNYDLLMEEALENNHVPYFDGFVGSHETFFDLQSIEEDKLPTRWGRLWKIHGSLNWYEDKKGAVRRGGSKGGLRRVIYPSHLKYDETRRMPYMAMIDRLRAFLRKDSAVLVSIGFSFNDHHLNELLVQGLQGGPTSMIFALLYGKLDAYSQIAKIAGNRSNINVMARDAGVIGMRRYDWPQGRDAKSCDDSIAVEWLDNAAKPGLKAAQFTLGDFGSFASFLEDLTGEYSLSARP